EAEYVAARQQCALWLGRDEETVRDLDLEIIFTEDPTDPVDHFLVQAAATVQRGSDGVVLRLAGDVAERLHLERQLREEFLEINSRWRRARTARLRQARGG
ncbi:unnamed protein product, partial [Laminaria digitata]